MNSDSVLQRIIRRSLDESGCPQHIVSDLIENAHERKWPGGLATLETRQLNRRYYDDYVTKRIPGTRLTFILSNNLLLVIYGSLCISHL